MSADGAAEPPTVDADSVRVKDVARQRSDAPPRELEVTQIGEKVEIVGASQSEYACVPASWVRNLEAWR